MIMLVEKEQRRYQLNIFISVPMKGNLKGIVATMASPKKFLRTGQRSIRGII